MNMFAELKDINSALSKKFNLVINVFFIIMLNSFIFYPALGNAESTNITGIHIVGNQRIESQTILSISGLSIGERYSDTEINNALLRLNATKYFKLVKVNLDKKILTITVEENPTINSINFEGNFNLKDENLLELIATRERQTFSASKIEHDAEKIAKAYNISGRNVAQVTPKIINKSNNRIDLVFEINEGEISEIEKITFTGNRNFSDTRLRGVIATKQAGIFRRFIKSDTYIKDRLDYDLQLLRDFYINKGFINFNVISTSSKMTREKDAFLINYSIEEGQKYEFGNISILSKNDNIDLINLNKLNKIKRNSTYDPRKLKKLIEEIEISLSKDGTNFINVIPRLLPDNDKLDVNIEINLSQSNKLFVERIDVTGNSTTLDEVIRFKFDFVEGDAFDKRKVEKSIDRIRALGFFSNVGVTTREGSSSQKIIIDLNVEEKATGSLGIGAGYNSSDGSVLTFNISERNFLGKGQKVDLDISNSNVEKQMSLGLEDPTFLDRNLLAGISFGRKSSTPYSVPLKNDNTYFAPKIKFPLSMDSTLSLIYRYDEDLIKLSSPSVTVSPLVSADVGDEIKSAIVLSYNLNKANSLVRPTAGYNFEVKQEINGLGGDIKYLKTALDLKTYNTLFTDDIILASNLSSGIINGNDANVLNRFSLGGDELPGFRNYGIGPNDNGDPLGGKMFAAFNLEASFPIGVPEEYGVFGGIFIGAGSVWKLDNTSSGSNVIDDSAKVRSAAGVSLFWDTIIGPLRFNFSRPIQKEINDITENFRFTVDTRF
ncbi:putative outer membrane protein [Rhodobacterales bacterium HTCC2255]|nr:putative outer membrane protein [Rhodobacterales bacterium HTCC2255]